MAQISLILYCSLDICIVLPSNILVLPKEFCVMLLGHFTSEFDFSLSDSDWAARAGSIDIRKSISGNVFNLGSVVIFWSSKKQDVVALSSSKAEYVAVTSAACQAVWLRKMLVDVSISKRVR
uniref:Reverse transcriptase Ty1/copia-type domain-containing protein n=1 Tax=Solanum lycopersicum TaxID=4081 RepID=A0A3Q7HMH4_SOLLC